MEEAPEDQDDEEKWEANRTSGTARRWEERVVTMGSRGRTVVGLLGVEKTPLSGCRTSGGREEDEVDAQLTGCCERQVPLLALLIQRRKTSMRTDEGVEMQGRDSSPNVQDEG